MFLDERRNKIIEILNKNGKVLVKELAKEFSLGEGMIRKDLQILEKNGKLKRTYGGAIPINNIAHSSTLKERIIDKSNEKSLIVEKMFNLIDDGDIIFLDVSSTNYLLAEKLGQSQKKTLVITNMPNIVSILTNNNNLEIILIGGTFNKKIGGVIGSNAVKEISKFSVDKSFIGSCGINFEKFKVTNFDLEDGNTKKTILNISKESYLIIESRKFNLAGLYSFANLEDFDYIITENKIKKEYFEKIKEKNINII